MDSRLELFLSSHHSILSSLLSNEHCIIALTNCRGCNSDVRLPHQFPLDEEAMLGRGRKRNKRRIMKMFVEKFQFLEEKFQLMD
jgi:hypothetical protein